MPKKDIFDKPFDEGTIAKLEIFEKYLETWLPTFIMGNLNRPIQIFDFFAGAGYDKNKTEGSPLRSLRIISKYRKLLREKEKKVYLYLNDLDKDKIAKSKEYCNNKIAEYGLNDVVEVEFSNRSFVDSLKLYNSKLNFGCNLVFIDQNGFKEVNETVFKFLINLETTDFLFFISSTIFHRFRNLKEVQNLHPKFDYNKIKNCSRRMIHNVISKEFVKYVPDNIKSYSIIPFSIMKEDKNNVYGLVFVTKHVYGAEKFLKVAWDKNKLNGNANFDIEDDVRKAQQNLFEHSLTKIEAFQEKLSKLILDKKLLDNIDVYIHTINEGHITTHAKVKLLEMKKNKLIDFDKNSPLVTYDNYNNGRLIKYKVLKNDTVKN